MDPEKCLRVCQTDSGEGRDRGGSHVKCKGPEAGQWAVHLQDGHDLKKAGMQGSTGQGVRVWGKEPGEASWGGPRKDIPGHGVSPSS